MEATQLDTVNHPVRIPFFRIVIYSLVFAALLLFVSAPASAGTITIRLKMSITRVADRVHVTLTANNTGTSPAHRVNARLQMLDQRLESDTLPRLDAQQSTSFQFDIAVPPGSIGTYPVVGNVIFHDANHYQFSALAASPFHIDHETVSDLTVSAPEFTITRKGKLPVKIGNLSLHSSTCRIILYLPCGLTGSKLERTLQFEPLSTQIVDFLIENRYDSGPAAYPVYCSVEYEKDGLHYLKLMQTIIRTRGAGNWFIVTRWYWLAGLIPIVLISAFVWLKRMRSGE